MKLSISEILLKTCAQSVDDRPSFLRKHKSSTLIELLQLCFDPRLVWMLPPGNAPFKPTKLVDQDGSLYFNMRRMYLFVKFNDVPLHKTLTQNKREALFIEMLETLTPEDAKFLISIKDKKMPYSVITPALLEKAFPGEIFFGDKKSPPVKTPKVARAGDLHLVEKPDKEKVEEAQ